MHKIMKISLFCLPLILGAASVQAGELLSFVKSTYCASMGSARQAGCYAYWDVRVTNGDTRSNALSSCNTTCSSSYSEPVDVRSCKAGCSTANGKDK